MIDEAVHEAEGEKGGEPLASADSEDV
jgi:hypothetical protein